MADRIQMRRDVASSWATINPILAQGEIGLEIGSGGLTEKFKIGDGATAWNILPYFNTGSGAGGLLNNEIYYIYTCTANNEVTFTLPSAPLNAYAVRMFPEGGIEFINSIDFTVAATIVSYIAPSPAFEIGDVIVFKYIKQ